MMGHPLYAQGVGPQHALLVLVFIAGCNERTAPSGVTFQSASADLRQVTPDYSLTAAEFGAEHKGDSDAAFRKYLGKSVELSGVVRELNVVNGQRPYVRIANESADPHDEYANILCRTRDDEPWANVGLRQRVKVRGKAVRVASQAASMSGLEDCVIVPLGANPTIVVTAPRLAAVVQNEPSQREDYGGRMLSVTGQVIEKKGQDVYLKGIGKTDIKCHFDLGQKYLADRLMIGQTVKITGVNESWKEDFIERFGHLTGCLTITKP